MNQVQKRLLDIAKLNDIEKIRRVDLFKLVGCEYPSQVTHHLRQLIKRGDLVRKNGRLIPAITSDAGLIRIPVMGEADCGEATRYADGRIDDYLMVSPSLLSIGSDRGIYALVARGDSMNHARVANKEIHDGDYVIVEKKDNYTPNNNDIVVSNIGGVANIKRVKYDPANMRLLLLSDSYRQQDFSPIIISEDDDFQVDGRVVEVIKGIAK